MAFVLRHTYKRLRKTLRASRPWCALNHHMCHVACLDPAQGWWRRVWKIHTSKMRIVYDQVVGCKRALPPLVTSVSIRRRTVEYRSLAGRTAVVSAPTTDAYSGDAEWVAAYDRKANVLTFRAPAPPAWVRGVWALERACIRLVAAVNESFVLNRYFARKHANRSPESWALFSLT